MSNIVFSQEAIKDLGQIKAYICDDLGNEKSATGTVRKIMQNIRQLANFPLSGAHLRSIIDYETDYRYIVCGNYTVFYRVNHNTVYIVRVLYGRRDYMRILFEETK